ncbi:MAG: cupin domain-containing protein, partial [Chloroflexia bacterium]|nr:cupin domain-containing protein [Chloroflexia bacterium]
MTYKPSPRPTFDVPVAIPYGSVTRYLWGDADAGEVADWIYVSSDCIHQLVYGLPPGGAFRHSESFRTIFAADVVYYVLSGVLVIANPDTGEVQRLLPGDAAFFRRDTWHHAFNYSTEPLRVLEFFAPPPSQGTSGAYARAQPYLTDSRYTRDGWLERWPTAATEEAASRTIHPIRADDVLWHLQGKEHPLLVGLLVSTEHLTVGRIELLPGQKSEVECHAGDEGVYVLSGTVHIRPLVDS